MKTVAIKRNMDGYKAAISFIDEFLKNSDVTVTISKGIKKRRTLTANALQAVWINEIAKHTGDSEESTRRYVKRVLALPIIRHDSSPQSEVINWTLSRVKYDLMSPKQQDKLLEIMAVTSVMDTKQHKKLLTEMQNFYREMNIYLEVR